MNSKLVGLWNRYGQCLVVKAETAHLPHVEARWYEGGIWACGVTAILPDETAEQAAQRVPWHKVPFHYRDTFEAKEVELRADYWRA